MRQYNAVNVSGLRWTGVVGQVSFTWSEKVMDVSTQSTEMLQN